MRIAVCELFSNMRVPGVSIDLRPIRLWLGKVAIGVAT